MRSSAESPHSAPQQSPKPSRKSSAPSPAPTMSESPDVEMGGVGIETTNGHSRNEGIADNGGSDHVTSEHSEAEEETFRGPSNLGDTSLSKNINGDPTPAGSKHTSAETMSNRSVEAKSLPVNGESPASGIPRKDKAESRPVNGEAHLSGGSRRSATSTSPRKPPTTTPSKSLQASSESIKMSKEEARLKEVLSETSAQVMQKVLRGEWRSFLFEGFSEDHISFVLRAILKNSARSPRIVDNVLNDLPTLDKLLDRPAVVSKILGSASYTQILKHVSTDVLDQALAERLKTVDAKDLVNYLARANRLGYGPDDVLDEADEHVTCIIASTSQEVPEVLQVEVPRPQRNIPPSQPNAQNDMQQDPLLLEQQRNRTVVEKKYAQIGTCPECHETFPTFAGYTYHVSKKKCGKEGKPVDGWKFWCDNCKTGFTGKQGKEYHVMNNVCNRSDNIAPATSPSGQLQQEAQQSHPAIRVPSNTQLSQPIPPTRPPMYQQPNNSVPTPSQQGPQAPLTRPPIHKPAPAPNTPASGKKKFRRLVSELTPQESEALHSDLNREIQRYNQSVIDLKAKYSGTDLENRLTTAHNGHGTKMSNIRNSHGVTLRMRQKEKDERIAAGYTPPSNSQVGQIKAISGNSPRNSSPLVPSFSPVNGSGSKSGSSAPRAPPMSQPARMPYLPSHLPNPAGYTAPPMGGALRAPNQYSPPHPDPLIHTRAGIDNPSPYGVMKLTDVRSPNPNKRRRSSEDGSSPRPNGPASAPRPQPWFANTQNRTVSQPQPSPSAPGLSMMEMRSEDAASKLAGYYKTLNKPETNRGTFYSVLPFVQVKLVCDIGAGGPA
ncbi:uncharacterized protein PAC_11662 [Phialocephala subalpina]|uniref:Uncharacterized protein n=1 Tax=Phialocephala subalpina TaxID=576137 RepID=A0A1L7X9Q5_9HELO|nr:uncharacterized protein PAC_11662 [Phialocephala subalpina]